MTRRITLDVSNPALAKEWHPKKNGTLAPRDVSPNSREKVWWKCPKGDDHEWKARIVDRNSGTGCPICSGNKVVRSTSFGVLDPEQAKLWHPTKNGELTPYDVSTGSGKRVWFKCPKGDDHEWESTVVKRKIRRNCPICTGQKIVKSNCLATLNPELAKEWHPSKNGDLTPFDVPPSTHRKVWWKCPKGDDHEYQSQVANKSAGKGCPICRGLKVVKSNSLATLNPQLAKEWHPTKNGKLTPHDVSAVSGKMVWWKCPKGDDHVWKSTIANRHTGQGCSICSGKTIVESNSLATLNPQLAKEWHPTKNGKLTPHDVSLVSGKKVWWRCSENSEHQWKAPISSRNITGCPSCAEYGFNPNKPTSLYYITINANDKLYYKIGITNNNVNKRYTSEDKLKFKEVREFRFKKGFDAFYFEQLILKENAKLLTKEKDILKDGNTEIFEQDVFEKYEHEITTLLAMD